MSRPSQNPSNASIPKLIHQSWSDNELPLKFQEWSDTWRTNHPDWEWVLWTDADNRALVKNHFPWFKDSYEKLNGEIFKADAVRPLYMYAFGGYVFRLYIQIQRSIYADLDVECLRPFDELFAAEIASSLANLEPSTSPPPCLYQYAFFGQMGTDTNSWSSIPNAWMASTPHHPFFLMPIESVVQGVGKLLYYWYVEGLTGPHALFHQIKRYQSYQGDNLKLLSYLRTVHIPQDEFDSYNLVHSITVFEPEVIFPFSFMMADSDPRKKHCLMSGAKKGDFDRERCKRDLMVRENGSYCITYWSHTWTPHGHDGWNLGAVQE